MLNQASAYYKTHVFFCINQRENGKKCCHDAEATKMFEYAKSVVHSLGLSGKEGIRINKAGCMDRCAAGPIIVIYPEGIWYTYRSQSDIDRIIEQHLLQNKIVEDLVI